jgi:hypothetical protein
MNYTLRETNTKNGYMTLHTNLLLCYYVTTSLCNWIDGYTKFDILVDDLN